MLGEAALVLSSELVSLESMPFEIAGIVLDAVDGASFTVVVADEFVTLADEICSAFSVEWLASTLFALLTASGDDGRELPFSFDS